MNPDTDTDSGTGQDTAAAATPVAIENLINSRPNHLRLAPHVRSNAIPEAPTFFVFDPPHYNGMLHMMKCTVYDLWSGGIVVQKHICGDIPVPLYYGSQWASTGGMILNVGTRGFHTTSYLNATGSSWHRAISCDSNLDRQAIEWQLFNDRLGYVYRLAIGYVNTLLGIEYMDTATGQMDWLRLQLPKPRILIFENFFVWKYRVFLLLNVWKEVMCISMAQNSPNYNPLRFEECLEWLRSAVSRLTVEIPRESPLELSSRRVQFVTSRDDILFAVVWTDVNGINAFVSDVEKEDVGGERYSWRELSMDITLGSMCPKVWALGSSYIVVMAEIRGFGHRRGDSNYWVLSPIECVRSGML